MKKNTIIIAVIIIISLATSVLTVQNIAVTVSYQVDKNMNTIMDDIGEMGERRDIDFLSSNP